MNDYFTTEWGAMTLQDWLGLIVTIVVFLLMIGLYLYVFHPANNAKLEAHRHIPLDDDFPDEDIGKNKHEKNAAEDQK